MRGIDTGNSTVRCCAEWLRLSHRFVSSQQAAPDAVMDALPSQAKSQPAIKASKARDTSDSPLAGAVPCATDTWTMHIKRTSRTWIFYV